MSRRPPVIQFLVLPHADTMTRRDSNRCRKYSITGRGSDYMQWAQFTSVLSLGRSRSQLKNQSFRAPNHLINMPARFNHGYGNICI